MCFNSKFLGLKIIVVILIKKTKEFGSSLGWQFFPQPLFLPICFDIASLDRFQRRGDRYVAFSRHSSIIHATKRALFQIPFAPANISPIQLSAYCARCARAQTHTLAHRHSIFRIVRRIPVVSGRDVKLPGG